MYWTSVGAIDTIERASMDGVARVTLHSTSLRAPFGLVLDHATQTLYWVDAQLGNLESSNVDGSDRSLVATFLTPCAYGITFFDQRLYWGDLCQHIISSVPVNSSGQISVISLVGVGLFRIQIVSVERQQIIGNQYMSWI